MKAGKFIDGVPYSWEEIYNLTGCCREDFLYDTSGECYNLLIEAIKGKKGEDLPSMKFICIRCGYKTVPKRFWSQNASIYYRGCANCSCGVFLHVPNK